MKKALVVGLSLIVLVSNSFAMSKTVKILIGSALVVGGTYMLVMGAQPKTSEKITSTGTQVNTTTTSDSVTSTNNPWGSSNTTTTINSTTTEINTDTNTLSTKETNLNDINMVYYGLVTIGLGTCAYIFINPTTKQPMVGVQAKF